MVFQGELTVWGALIYTDRWFDGAPEEQYTVWIISKTSL